MLTHAWIIPAIPALSFVLILAFGKKLPRGGSEIGIAAVVICFVLAITVGMGWIQRVDDFNAKTKTVAESVSTKAGEVAKSTSGETSSAASAVEGAAKKVEGGEVEVKTPPVVRSVNWLQSGSVKFQVGTMVDGLSAILLIIVTIISTLVHIYSTDYVAGDRRYTHYFAFLSLFTASMLFFVLTNNTLQLIVGWELVGVCSFALIGHWWEEKPNSDAALKAFLTNRVGDVGLLCGMITLFWASGGHFDIVRINTMANSGQITHLALLVASLSLMAAVMSKSGQFILHTWLPDAMAGPTPVSALIHAATMVVAGVYMIARLYPVFWQGFQIGTTVAGEHLNFMAVVGAVTLVFGALLAFVQSDIKKVLAYSTISQLGYMVMGLGVGAWTGSIFHLFTHAFFKACLFLGAGSVAHSIHSFDMKADYGGMWKTHKRTAITFFIGTLALMGIFPLSGFWSKDEILAGSGQFSYHFMLVFGWIGAFMTCAYMTRVIWYTFFGEPRGKSLEHPPHESGPRILVPLYILAGLSIITGFANFPWGPSRIALQFEKYVQPTGDYFPHVTAVDFNWLVAGLSTLVALAGISAAVLYFWKGKLLNGLTERNRAAKWGITVLENKYYLDWLYTDVIVGSLKGPIARAAYWFNQNVLDGVVNGAGRTAVSSGKWVYEKIDQGVVDTIVNGVGEGAEETGQALRKEQNGKVQTYGAYLFAGATLLALILVVVR